MIALSTNTVKAQIGKGSNNVEFGIGFSGIGIVGNAYYVKGFNNVLYGKFGGGIEVAQERELGYRSIMFDAFLGTEAFRLDSRGSFVVTAAGGISFYVDNLDQFPNDKTDKQVSGNYGLTLAPEVVMSMSRASSIVLYSHLRYTIKPTFNVSGNFRTNFGVALRLKI